MESMPVKADYKPGRTGSKVEDQDRRNRAIVVRLSVGEHEYLKILASSSKMQMAEYMRSSTFSKNMPPIIPEVNQKFVGDLGRIGGLLKRLIILLETGSVQSIQPKDVREPLEDLRRSLHEIRLSLLGGYQEK